MIIGLDNKYLFPIEAVVLELSKITGISVYSEILGFGFCENVEDVTRVIPAF